MYHRVIMDHGNILSLRSDWCSQPTAKLSNINKKLTCDRCKTWQMLPLLCVSASGHKDSPPGSPTHHRSPHPPWLQQQQESAGGAQGAHLVPAVEDWTGVLWPLIQFPLHLERFSPANPTSWHNVSGCCCLFLNRLQFLFAIRSPSLTFSFLCPGWSYLHFMTYKTVDLNKRRLLKHTNPSLAANAEKSQVVFWFSISDGKPAPLQSRTGLLNEPINQLFEFLGAEVQHLRLSLKKLNIPPLC